MKSSLVIVTLVYKEQNRKKLMLYMKFIDVVKFILLKKLWQDDIGDRIVHAQGYSLLLFVIVSCFRIQNEKAQ